MMELEEIIAYVCYLIDNDVSLKQHSSHVHAWLLHEGREWADRNPNDPRVIKAKELNRARLN
jgi:hypothetical protein